MKTAAPHGLHIRTGLWRVLLLVSLGGVLCTSGCGKKSAETAGIPTPTPTASDNSGTPSPTAPQPVGNLPANAAPTIATTADGGPDLKQLNHYYIGWIVQNRKRPKTFEQFVAASGVQVPPPPAGKKYVIDGNGFINLVNR